MIARDEGWGGEFHRFPQSEEAKMLKKHCLVLEDLNQKLAKAMRGLMSSFSDIEIPVQHFEHIFSASKECKRLLDAMDGEAHEDV